MKERGWTIAAIVGACGLSLAGWTALAAEHGGTTQEHGGMEHEHGGTTHEHGGQSAALVEPSTEAIRQAIRDYVDQVVEEDGQFTVTDEVTGAERSLELVRVHERVGKTGNLYYSCTDMKDTASGELLDLDFDVDASSGALNVVDVRIHKVDGTARYTYDDHDNRIPVM